MKPAPGFEPGKSCLQDRPMNRTRWSAGTMGDGVHPRALHPMGAIVLNLTIELGYAIP